MTFDPAFAKAYGFDVFFQNQLLDQPPTDFSVGRIIQEEKNLYRIQCGFTEVRWAEPAGRLFHGMESPLDRPAVGDWVLFKSLADCDRAVIHKIFTRRTCVYRRAVGGGNAVQILGANVDTVFVLSSLNRKLNLRRIERYLVLCGESGVQPVIVPTKRDLCTDRDFEDVRTSIRKEHPDIPLLGISVQNGLGLAEVSRFLKPGHTITLFGSSGVGKSTLINQLLREAVLDTQPIRNDDDKGRHTTTRRHLLLLPNGCVILDTPGLREIPLMDHQGGVAHLFDDIVHLEKACKYSNCHHVTEPDCAVKNAIETGTISLARWKSYLKLQRELTFQMQKNDKSVRSAQRENWKKNRKTQRQTVKSLF